MNLRSAVSKIERRGALLVYPIKNQREPASLWSEFFPKSKMRWEWDESADDRVADLWRLREVVSRSGKVVYAKWYQGRATFFSKEVFTLLLSALGGRESGLSQPAREILRVLEEDSPLSTKELKRRTGLRQDNVYEKATKELWRLLYIVGYGEVDDGAFPSLAVGATRLLFDDLWLAAQAADPTRCERQLIEKWGEQSPFLKYFKKVRLSPRTEKKISRGGVLKYEDLVGKS